MDNLVEINDRWEKGIEKESNNKNILRLSSDSDYEEFFNRCILLNEPCIIENATTHWQSSKSWVTPENEPNMTYLREQYGHVSVTVAQCDKKIYNVQEKITMLLSEYADYWKFRDKSGRNLYLKDWHFVKDTPSESVYRVPKFFASDWLNEYYNNHPELNDDYRFAYIGPKGTWTPLHADVFSSYSWSTNIVGQKLWIFLRPGVEEGFRDNLGNLIFEQNLNIEPDNNKIYKNKQGSGDAIFVPSGWHHQVWNLKDTISINHNWINGGNIKHMWASMKESLNDVKKEIEDCTEMENWSSHCQIMLRALFGFNYSQFYEFLIDIITCRIEKLRANDPLMVYGSWLIGQKHLLFDLKQAADVLRNFVENEDVHNLCLNSDFPKTDPDTFCNYVNEFLDNYY